MRAGDPPSAFPLKATADHGQRALLAVRARFFLMYRLAVRLSQLAAVDGAAKGGTWRTLLAVCVGIDIAVWWALRDPDRLGFTMRLILDSADVAIWSLGSYTPPSSYHFAVFIAVPLAIEVGMRRPGAAFVVPVVTFLATMGVRSLIGRPLAPLQFGWLVLAAVCGILLSRYDARLRRRAEEEWSRRRSAEDRRAYLAGQNAVAMGASSVVDGVEGVLPVLGDPLPGSALWRLADGWKSGLGASTRRVWMYLGDALLEWQRDHNRHPDLRSRVVLMPEAGTGTCLLTADQVRVLRRELAALPVPASYAVNIGDRALSQRPPGGSFTLHVGSHMIRVPADRIGVVRAYDPGPLLFALFGLLSIADVLFMQVAVPAAATCLGMYLGAAWWSHRRLQRFGHAGRPLVMLVAVGVAISAAALTTAAAGAPRGPSGVSYPIVPGLDLLAIMVCMYRVTLRRFLVGIVAVGAAAIPSVVWMLHQGSQPIGRLLHQLVWPMCALICAARYSRELETAVQRQADDFAFDDDAFRTRAFRAGRHDVVTLASQAVQDAYGRLDEIGPALGPKLSENVHHRLQEVDRRLEALIRNEHESPS